MKINKSGRPDKKRSAELKKRRVLILKMLASGISQRAIAKFFHVHPSNIMRLLKRKIAE